MAERSVSGDHARARVAGALSLLPGLAACLMVAVLAEALSRPLGQPSLIIGLVIGLLLHPLYPHIRRGVDFASKSILEIGIALLGFRVSLETLSALGLNLILVVIMAVFMTIVLTVALSVVIGADRRLGLLAGGATAICGASACLAIAAALPRDESIDRDAAVVVVGVTVLSTIAMLTYPYLVGMIGLNEVKAGAFLGATIHNVPQAVGAGYAVSPAAGDGAAIVKLLRVSLILPVTVAVATAVPFLLGRRAQQTAVGRSTTLPWFILAYLGLMLLNSAVALPKALLSAASTASMICLVASVVAIGIKTSARGILADGIRPLVLLLFSTLCLAAIVLAALICGIA